MIKYHIKLAIRYIYRDKIVSFIKILGLAIGFICTILIFLWVQDELSYDRYHKNVDNIYGIYTEYDNGNSQNTIIPYPVGPALKEKFPEVLDYTRIRFRPGTIKYGQNIYNEKRFCRADPSIFDVFSFPFIKGSPKTALSEPFSTVITEETAKRYFGNEDPINKTLTYNNWKDFMVTGVIKNIPKNSHLQFDFLVSYPINEGLGVLNSKPWGQAYCYTYVLLQNDISVSEFEPKITGLINDNFPLYKTYLKLLDLKKIHLSAIYGDGNIIYVYIFSVIAILILGIACINFMNLSTARYSERYKEIGLRKTSGAKRTQIIKQFFCESTLLTLISFLVAMTLIELILPYFNNFTGKHIEIAITHYEIIIGLIIILIITGIVAGSYPALFLSSFEPVKILRGKLNSITKGHQFRNILVIIQFSISIILIIGTSIIYSQLNFIHNKDIGFNKDDLICFRLNKDLKIKSELIKDELSTNPDIISTTFSRALPSSIYLDAGKLDWEDKEPEKEVRFTFSTVDFDYIETLKMDIVQGRNFSREFPTDNENYILNQEAIKKMGLKSPIGKRFTMWGFEGEIIGIVKDFHYNHFNTKIEPLVLTLHPFGYSYFIIRIKPDNYSGTIRSLENIWNKYSPEYPFEYFFLDENFANMYNDEEHVGEIFKYFALVTIFISCIGLFGLVSFSVQQRTKEIGIRKILGSSLRGILLLITKNYIRWVLSAFIIASPIAYYLMNRWLQNFAYKTNLSWWIFALAGGIALAIALLTVSWQSWRAARRNPVEALRYE